MSTGDDRDKQKAAAFKLAADVGGNAAYSRRLDAWVVVFGEGPSFDEEDVGDFIHEWLGHLLEDFRAPGESIDTEQVPE